MEFRFQHILLSICAIFSFLCTSLAYAEKGKKLRLNNEFFEFGVHAGVLNVQDFSSELTLGFSATFAASENFFLQYNYQVADVSLSTVEENPNLARFFVGDDRLFTHYDLLLGYNLFQSEFFVVDGYNTIGNLYTVIGVGNTNFGDEDRFTTTVGVGYKVGLTRKWQLRIDFRDYIYRSALISQDKDRTRHNTSFTAGISFLW